ncbi:type II toxin-antitoxin system Phd/YefM family antitoxin [Rhizobium sp. CG5]|uniref:type II toxin-antitoxin system Phd/YefM family antitoxin n=1 Tax=Rhizobium sp. CG5 TaxID=2726076 RepID=UPI002033B903|nr:type II toxin-antitoxin system Phd/YefM family antitoxin [Rhizobium sp. CG5]MCM2471924.1 type II toxin-antitoxin system Phd/YefM family antitoxin [Rhizobium sp. CG5]
MREIQLKDAKAKLSAVIDDAKNGDGAIITRHGRGEAVIISLKEYERLTKAIPSFGWLLTHAPLEDGDLPERGASPSFGKDFI